MRKPATNANDKPALLFLFASVFFWFGILFIWVLINEGDILYNLIPFAISALITLAGFFFYLVWIYRTILISLHNKLLFNPDSFTTTARFISTIESSYTAVNDRVQRSVPRKWAPLLCLNRIPTFSSRWPWGSPPG